MINLLTTEAAKLGIDITLSQTEQFMRYKDILLEWNEKFNLTAITDEKEVFLKHFLDSLSVVGYLKNANNVIDVGSGAGLPGIPVKIAKPQIDMVLLDSTQKKINFVNEASRHLGLDGITCIHARAEEAGNNPDLREQFDAAVSRAVAPLNILAEYCLPFVKTGGLFLAMKGPDAQNEAAAAEAIIKKLGGKLEDIKPTEISDMKHCIVIISKLCHTPTAYPRNQSKIVQSVKR